MCHLRLSILSSTMIYHQMFMLLRENEITNMFILLKDMLGHEKCYNRVLGVQALRTP